MYFHVTWFIYLYSYIVGGLEEGKKNQYFCTLCRSDNGRADDYPLTKVLIPERMKQKHGVLLRAKENVVH